jgi:hypothetical protein
VNQLKKPFRISSTQFKTDKNAQNREKKQLNLLKQLKTKTVSEKNNSFQASRPTLKRNLLFFRVCHYDVVRRESTLKSVFDPDEAHPAGAGLRSAWPHFRKPSPRMVMERRPHSRGGICTPYIAPGAQRRPAYSLACWEMIILVNYW